MLRDSIRIGSLLVTCTTISGCGVLPFTDPDSAALPDEIRFVESHREQLTGRRKPDIPIDQAARAASLDEIAGCWGHYSQLIDERPQLVPGENALDTYEFVQIDAADSTLRTLIFQRAPRFSLWFYLSTESEITGFDNGVLTTRDVNVEYLDPTNGEIVSVTDLDPNFTPTTSESLAMLLNGNLIIDPSVNDPNGFFVEYLPVDCAAAGATGN